MKNSPVRKFFNFAREHRLRIKRSDRILGIRDLLLAWGLIGISLIIFQNPRNITEIQVNFFIQFITGIVIILTISVSAGLIKNGNFKGIHFIRILRSNETSRDHSHLSIRQRLFLIYIRGFIATAGYIIFELAKTSVKVIDNSAIHGADALMYALLSWCFLKQRFNLWEWIGIVVASFGLSFFLFFDIQDANLYDALVGFSFGLCSSIALSLMIMLSSVIIQHDPPLRVAFHQCVSGVMVIVFLTIFLGFNFTSFNMYEYDYQNAILGGACYSIALIFFLRAFLYIEPIIIAVSGFSLFIYVIVFEKIIHNELITSRDFISSSLIALGCGILIFQEYKKDKKKNKLEKAVESSKPIYKKHLSDEIFELSEKFKNDKINKYEYINEIYEYNKILFSLSKQIKCTDIKKIILESGSVIFQIGPYKINIEVDQSCRSAPFEIMNFGDYEKEDELIIYEILQDGCHIFDIGAHIGWHTLNFSKRFPNAKIHAFEPIKPTFSMLKKNVQKNKAINVDVHNIGLSDKDESTEFFYNELASPVASRKNIFDIDKNQKIQCSLKTVDAFMVSHNILKLDFIKIDVEGAEKFVIQGALKTIEKYKPVMVLELVQSWCEKFDYHADDVLVLLKKYGYKSFLVYGKFLKETSKVDLENDEKFNYFFLHELKHQEFIKKFSKSSD